MDNAPALTQKLNYNDKEVLETIKATIAPDATPMEFKMFISFCQSTGLNPFKKEIWFIKVKGYTKKTGERTPDKVQMMLGINGFYSIANNHPQYDGMEEVEFEYNDKNEIVSAKAKVSRKDRKFPSVGVALWNEYAPEPNDFNKNSIWFSKPTLMLSKVAESIALRKAFPQELNGLYTTEEMPANYAAKEVKEDESTIRDMKHDKHPLEIYEGKDEVWMPPEEKQEAPKQSYETDWSSLPYRYHLPVKKAGKDMNAVRDALKAKGFKFNPDDTHWYGAGLVPKLEEYLRPLGVNTETGEVTETEFKDEFLEGVNV